MLSILIVDDDTIIRKGLIKIIEKMNLNITHFYEADNGESALDILLDSNPSIVITDIKMYRMNGIEFIKQARKHKPNTPFIILSGYNDFEFAKSAIQNNVVEYLLKPLRKDELFQALEKAIEIHNCYTHTLNLQDNLRNHFFKDLITNFSSTMPYEKMLESLDIILPYNHFIATYFTSKIDTSAYLFYLKDYFICSQYEDSFGNTTIILNIDAPQYDSIVTNLQNHLSHLDAEIFCGVSSLGSSLESLHKLTEESQIASLMRFIQYENHLFVYNSKMLIIHKGISLSPHYLAINQCLKQNDPIYLSTCINQLLKAIITYKYISPALFTALLEEWWNHHILSISSSKIEIAAIYSTSHTLEELKNNIVCSIQDILSHREDILYHSKLNVTNPKLATAIKYIDSHFSKIDSIADVPNYIAVTPNYLGKLFKTELGINFSEFLLQVRLDQAKKLLLNPQYKIYEIASLVGFEDDKYFLKLFKKYVGVTPSQYRMSS